MQHQAHVPQVWPTHGTGSFCAAPPGAARTSTVGIEKTTNPLLAAPDEDTFGARLLGGLGSYPASLARLGELSRHDQLVATGPSLAPLDAATVRRLRADGGLRRRHRRRCDGRGGHGGGGIHGRRHRYDGPRRGGPSDAHLA